LAATKKISVRSRNVIPRRARYLNCNPLALKPGNSWFLPFFAKIDDVTPYKK